MSNNQLSELHSQHSIGEQKYTYFLLAVTASAVAFAIQKTDVSLITISLLPLGCAVLCWGGSFYFGVNKLKSVQAALTVNERLLKLEMEIHPDQPDDPQEKQKAIDLTMSALKLNIDDAQFYSDWQFRLLITGAVLFICWHIVEMILRTYAL